MNQKPLSIAGIKVNPGERKALELPAPNIYTQHSITIPIHVIHGKKKGPRIFVMAAVHGDEINGIEIIRRLLSQRILKTLNGTLIVVPVANVYGFITAVRYLPDRRDLNRSFPGSKLGSLSARLANLFMEEIISKCTHGIDLHTGNIHIENLPHIRTNLDVPGALRFARFFRAPIIMDAKLRDGSLRQAATELNIPVLVYEGGEALRFNELAIRIGLHGILNVLSALKMISIPKLTSQKNLKSRVAYHSSWVRSPESGIVHPLNVLGSDVEEGEKIGIIANPFAKKEKEIISPIEGVIIGKSTFPLANEGDALFHVARLKQADEVIPEINKLGMELGSPFNDL